MRLPEGFSARVWALEEAGQLYNMTLSILFDDTSCARCERVLQALTPVVLAPIRALAVNLNECLCKACFQAEQKRQLQLIRGVWVECGGQLPDEPPRAAGAGGA